MKKLKILYLSKNMKEYKSASYQEDVMDELSKQAEVFFYGPGFLDYNLNDSIENVIEKSPFKIDCIILGHSWLYDRDGAEVDPHPLLNLSNTKVPKVVILNKEYTNLEAKLAFIRKNYFNIGFTHHHDIKKYTKSTNVEFNFWPFAFGAKKFSSINKEKIFDIGFSGILQNLNKNAGQSDIRVGIMNFFFQTLYDVPLVKKKSYRNIKIFWNSIPRSKLGRLLSKILYKHKFLDSKAYVENLSKTKIYINTLSPMGLISPRFFESMASRSIVLCEASPLYSNIFPKGTYIEFKNDLSDFEEIVQSLLTNNTKKDKIVDKAYKLAYKEHTWEKRVSSLLNLIQKNLKS
ncbi:glycosyltransferase [Candidatus Thioglobus sp.]|jgi:spore maturation protein CgeB|nr:glycosyltransferase [Candidatus Thioglobus sp.]MDA8872021.1 glycosyltransferase [Candidatus Thioglobus sp.]